jgi:hypothetical protein
MDPYLEDPYIWPGFHNSLATEIERTLNRDLPEGYYAQIDVRTEVGITDEPGTRIIVPDVSVRGHPWESAGGVAVLEPRAALSESVEIVLDVEPTRLCNVEVRDRRPGHAVVTVIEILSPANKKRGPDRDKFVQKRNEVLSSEASLVEIDLLRAGTRLWTEPEVAQRLAELQPPPDYLVAVNRAWHRDDGYFRLQLFPICLDGLLPVFPVPLRRGEDELPLDLQYLVHVVYDGGPYRRGAVDYTQPPTPPLPEPWRDWAAERVQAGRGQ